MLKESCGENKTRAGQRRKEGFMRLGALEAGGTKMVCAVGNETGEIFEQISIPTETPEITMPKLIAYFKDKQVDALGIGCFGPVELDRQSPEYGHITTTPKLAWRNYDIVGAFREALGCPVGFDTDVNGSVLGEVTFGQAKGKKCVIYLTIGTGVGGGIYIDGKLLHGMLHPEAGHVLIRKKSDDAYEGKCPYHKTCLEGLAAGPAIEARWGQKAVELKDRPGVESGGGLHRAGAGGLYPDALTGDDHFRRRRDAPGTAFPIDPGKSDPDAGRLYPDGRAGGYGALYRACKPARRSGNHGLSGAGKKRKSRLCVNLH